MGLQHVQVHRAVCVASDVVAASARVLSTVQVPALPGGARCVGSSGLQRCVVITWRSTAHHASTGSPQQ